MARRITRNHFQQDVHTSWRRQYCYLTRAGVTRKAKRIANRADRHQQRHELRAQAHQPPQEQGEHA